MSLIEAFEKSATAAAATVERSASLARHRGIAMATLAPAPESPRAVANKSSKRTLLAAIRMALRIESPAVRRNTQTFNRNRYAAIGALADYDQLKDRTRAIKESAIAGLPELLATLEASVKRNGLPAEDGRQRGCHRGPAASRRF